MFLLIESRTELGRLGWGGGVGRGGGGGARLETIWKRPGTTRGWLDILYSHVTGLQPNLKDILAVSREHFMSQNPLTSFDLFSLDFQSSCIFR